jgi:seryl-tRNA synthetase
MPPVKLSKPDQFLHENKTWGRMLEFFKQENSFLKNRLSEVLDLTTDNNFLALAEQFQNKFILKDEFIDELRHDINEQDKRIAEGAGTIVDGKVIKRQEKLRNEMEYFENDFNRLRNDFNKYLATIL